MAKPTTTTRIRTYKAVLEQIDTLKARANALRGNALREAVARVKAIMRDHALSWPEVQAALGHGAKASKGAPRAGARSGASGKGAGRRKRTSGGKDGRAVVKPKYRHPESGATWSGRGHTPRWLAAEIKSGKQRDSFLIEA